MSENEDLRVAAAYECRIHGARRIVLVAGTPTAPAICHNLWMCGRYRLSHRKQMIEEYFDSVSGEDDWNPRYNIAPRSLVCSLVSFKSTGVQLAARPNCVVTRSARGQRPRKRRSVDCKLKNNNRAKRDEHWMTFPASS
jgi:putative SOS response-associated peptidase YedK